MHPAWLWTYKIQKLDHPGFKDLIMGVDGSRRTGDDPDRFPIICQ